MEVGRHHHVSGKYLSAYPREAAWREDNRPAPNGKLYFTAIRAALAHPVSEQWKGY